ATGGVIGTGGVAGVGGNGSGGSAGSGGMGGTGGPGGGPATGGMSGHGGTGGRPPSCASFPSGTSLSNLGDGRLHCYWVHGSQIDWNSAEAVCENDGGTLVTILSEAENTTVVQLAAQANLFMGIGMSGQVFIGATDGRALDDRNGAGDYSWVTGEPWGYENWHSGQPDGACTGCSGPGPNAGCACDHRGAITADGTWFDRTQTTTRPFVCEAIAR
ncbi:MAG TPA: C-type lectin domain-containing protein, partial [Polyangia bacterium]|nr:C-type lectin domain-containing protein [Polyangia bacterium]